MRRTVFKALALLAFTTLPLAGQRVATFVLDESGSMAALRSTGNTRCHDAKATALLNLGTWFTLNPTGLVNVISFGAGGAVTNLTSGAFVNQVAATAAINSIVACTGSCTPLAQAICDGVTALAARTEPFKDLYIYSDGAENCSSTSGCIGTLPSATTGCKCSGQAGSFWPVVCTTNFPAGTWQDAICTMVQSTVSVNYWYFNSFESVTPSTFGRALALASGGSYSYVADSDLSYPGEPWLRSGAGWYDDGGTLLRVQYDGTPRLGQTISLSMSASVGRPFYLIVGLSDTNSIFGLLPLDLGLLGAANCSLYVSYDVTLFSATGTPLVNQPGSQSWASLFIPLFPSLVGLPIHVQGVQVPSTVNSLGLSTSDYLTATIAL